MKRGGGQQWRRENRKSLKNILAASPIRSPSIGRFVGESLCKGYKVDPAERAKLIAGCQMTLKNYFISCINEVDIVKTMISEGEIISVSHFSRWTAVASIFFPLPLLTFLCLLFCSSTPTFMSSTPRGFYSLQQIFCGFLIFERLLSADKGSFRENRGRSLVETHFYNLLQNEVVTIFSVV